MVDDRQALRTVINMSFKSYLRRPAGLSSVKLDGVNIISIDDRLDSLGEPVGSLRVGEVNVARYGTVVVPPGRVGAALFVEDQVAEEI